MSEENTDYSSLPIEDRLVHKVWKVRLEAYEELTKRYESSRNDKDDCFYVVQDFKKIVIDSNVVAQEAGINLLWKYLEFGGSPGAVKNLKNSGVVTSLCEKGLLSSRAGTKDKANQCILMFVEICALSDLEGIIEDILNLLGNRLPKLVAGCVSCLGSIVANFGCQTIPPKLIIPYLPKLFAHADRNVRAETQKLTLELYKWLKDALATILFPDLKPIQQKELTKAFESVSENGVQIRFTRKQQAEIERKRIEAEEAAAAAAAAAAVSTASGMEGEDVIMQDAASTDDQDYDSNFQAFDLIEPVEVLSKLPADFSSRISSSNWKERKEVLDEVHSILEKTVRLEPKDDYSEIMRIFTKSMKDANIQVVQLAADCVQFLANGLQKNFHKYQHFILSPMLERTKEKKASVAEALNKSLDSIFKSSSLSDILEETINTGLKHKTPQVKIATTNYLQRCLAETRVVPKLAEIDMIMEVGVKLLSDSQEPVRRASTEMIGTLMKITGVRELNQFLEKVDDNRKSKVMEFYEKVVVKAKKSAAVPAPSGRSMGSASSTSSSSSSAAAANSAVNAGSIKRAQPMRTIPAPSSSKLSLPSASALKKPRSALNTIPSKRGATSPVKSDLPRSSIRSSGIPNSRPMPNGASLMDDGISSAERDELLQLRQQAISWKQKEISYQQQLQQRSEEDKLQFEQELSSLQRRNESLMKDYNSSQIIIKQKETQILRLTSDLESSKLKIRDLEQSVELKKLQQDSTGLLFQAPNNPEQSHGMVSSFGHSFQNSLPVRNTSGNGVNRYSTLFLNEYPTSRITSGELSSRVNRLSIDPEQSKEDQIQSLSGNTKRFSSPTKMAENTNTYYNRDKDMEISNNDDSWKRAAEVTNQLKARIEKMKARSRVNFNQ